MILDVRSVMHEIALEHPWYGYRPMTRALRRHGFTINKETRAPTDATGQSGRIAALVANLPEI